MPIKRIGNTSDKNPKKRKNPRLDNLAYIANEKDASKLPQYRSMKNRDADKGSRLAIKDANKRKKLVKSRALASMRVIPRTPSSSQLYWRRNSSSK